MNDDDLRRYASGEVSLATLQDNGFGSYLDILWRLGELGLRPPVAPFDGPHAELRRRSRAIIAERIRNA